MDLNPYINTEFCIALNWFGPKLGPKWIKALSVKTGLNYQYCWQIKSGARKGSDKTKRKMAKALGFNLTHFLYYGEMLTSQKEGIVVDPMDGVKKPVIYLGREYELVRDKHGGETHIVDGEFLSYGKDPIPFNPQSDSDTIEHTTDHFAQVPLISAHLSAGNGTFIEAENIESFLMFRKDWLNSKGGKNDKYALLVDGDSMEPEIRDGDLVLIDTSEDGRRPRPGKIFAARQLNTIVIKKLMPDETNENIVRLISENSAYPPITIDLADDSNKILGRVIWMAREL